MSKYDVDIAGTIGKVIPFYVRGRKISLLLQAVAYPLVQLHAAWTKWAEERIIEASITSQALSLAWYLTHLLNARFIDKTESFIVYNGLDEPTNVIFCEAEYLDSDSFSQHVYSEDEEDIEDLTMTIRCPQEIMEYGISYAIVPPEIEETSTYDNTDYRHEISNIVKKYNTSFKEYQILV